MIVEDVDRREECTVCIRLLILFVVEINNEEPVILSLLQHFIVGVVFLRNICYFTIVTAHLSHPLNDISTMCLRRLKDENYFSTYSVMRKSNFEEALIKT